MCGITAISLSPRSKVPIRRLQHELLLHSEERGKVAGGWAFIQSGKLAYHKEDRPGGHVSLDGFNRQVRLAIGHTRNATVGDPSVESNNHPVIDSSNEIALVHNGVVMNHPAIRKGLNERQEGDDRPAEEFAEVDSSVLPALVRDYGYNGLTSVDGWASVAWLDLQSPGTLFLARTSEKAPLVIVGLKDGSIIVGSTFQIIHAALVRVGFGDAVRWSIDLAPWTYAQVRNGQIDAMANITPYSYQAAMWKGGRVTGYTEKELQDITSGKVEHLPEKKTTTAPTPPKASNLYGKSYFDGKVWDAKAKAYVDKADAPKTGASSYTPPLPGTGVGTSPHHSWSQGPAPTQKLEPGEDPFTKLKGFKPSGSESPIPPTTSGSVKVYSKGAAASAAPKSPVTKFWREGRPAYPHLTDEEVVEASTVAQGIVDDTIFFSGETNGHGEVAFDIDCQKVGDNLAEALEYWFWGLEAGWVKSFGIATTTGELVELQDWKVEEMVDLILSEYKDRAESPHSRGDFLAVCEELPEGWSFENNLTDAAVPPHTAPESANGNVAVDDGYDDLVSENAQAVNDYLNTHDAKGVRFSDYEEGQTWG